MTLGVRMCPCSMGGSPAGYAKCPAQEHDGEQPPEPKVARRARPRHRLPGVRLHARATQSAAPAIASSMVDGASKPDLGSRVVRAENAHFTAAV